MVHKTRTIITAFLSAITFSFLPAASQAENHKLSLSIELNSIQTNQNGCRLTFVAHNQNQFDIEKLVFETVLFTKDGSVASLTLFDFGSIPQNVPRVRQFEIPGNSCEGLGQVLINGIDSCVTGGSPNKSCSLKLNASSRTSIRVLG